MSRLTKEEIVVLKALREKNEGKMSKSALACLLHVSEGTVRYHLKREKEDASDRRKNKPMKADAFARIIEERMKISKGDNPSPSIEELYEGKTTDKLATPTPLGKVTSLIDYLNQ